MKDCINIIKDKKLEVTLQHVYREANLTTNWLTKKAYVGKYKMVWLQKFLEKLCSIASDDIKDRTLKKESFNRIDINKMEIIF